MVTDHATLVHLLKQQSDKLTDWQTRRVEKLMPYANLIRILYMKGILEEADPVSRCPDFLPVDNMYMPDESLWCNDENVPYITYNGKDLLLPALLTLESLNVDNCFLIKLKGACFSCYLSDENIDRRKGQLIYKSSDGLFRYRSQSCRDPP